jgi:hypothetical protein
MRRGGEIWLGYFEGESNFESTDDVDILKSRNCAMESTHNRTECKALE